MEKIFLITEKKMNYALSYIHVYARFTLYSFKKETHNEYGIKKDGVIFFPSLNFTLIPSRHFPTHIFSPFLSLPPVLIFYALMAAGF